MRVLRVDGGNQEYVEDPVVEDVLFRLFVNGELVASMNVLREKLLELTYGYLYTSGCIKAIDQVEDVSIQENDAHVTLSLNIDHKSVQQKYVERLSEASSTPSHFMVRDSVFILTPALIQKAMDELNERGDLFKKTGGTHSALLYMDDEVVAFSQDVGRFNALDKVVGEALLNGIDLKNVLLATSGRLAGEMVLKASNAGVPVMCSVSAPIKSGVNIAKASGMTLIGFARDARFNVYSGFERIA